MKTQSEILAWFKTQPLFHYKKFGTFPFRRATESQTVITIIDGVVETTNQANPGDYIITGLKGEEFVMPAETFANRYKIITELFPDNTRGLAEATGECWAMCYGDEDFTFMGPWGEEMICNQGDFLCAPDDALSKVYRIERDIFFATYKLENPYAYYLG